MRILPIAATIIAATTFTTSCSNDSKALTTLPDTASPNPTNPPTSPDTTTTAPPTTTTAPPTTTTPDTTAPPNTSTPPPVDEATRQAIIQAAIDSHSALHNAQLDPTNQAQIDEFPNTMTGDFLSEAHLLLLNMVDRQHYLVQNEQVPTELRPDPDTIELTSNDRATIETCLFDGSIVMERNGNEDGTDKIIDDRITRRLIKQTYILENHQWRLASQLLISREMGAISCEIS